MLNHVLGGGLSSRLFQKVREQRGLAYSVWSERAAYQDAGSLAVVVGHGARARRRGAAHRRAASSSCWPTDGVTERELAVAKGNLRAEMLLSGEDSGARMSRIGASLLLHGEVLSVDEVLARIDAVDRAQVLDVAGGAGAVAAHHERGRPLRRTRLRVPPARHGRPVACRPCRGSVWSAPAAAWAKRSAAPSPRRPTWSWWRPSTPAHVGADACGRTIVGEVNALRDLGAEVVVDFTIAEAVRHNVAHYAHQGIHAVIGTSGLSDADLAAIAQLFEGSGANAVVAANFAIGAVLLLHLCRIAAPHMDGVEVIELHHDAKRDAPSGTAMHTAAVIAAARRAAGSGPLPPDPTTDVVLAGARGARGRRRRPRALGAAARPRGARGGHLRRAGPEPEHPPRLLRPPLLHARRPPGGAGRGRPARAHAWASRRCSGL